MSEAVIIFQKGESKGEKCELSILEKKEWDEWKKPVWNISLNFIKKKTHSANFPPELVKRLVKMYSFFGETILDPFAGTGTTLRIAQELNRKAVGYEIYI